MAQGQLKSITAEGLEDKVSPSTPTAQLSERQDNDLWHLTRRLKSLQHEMLQPEMGQHMEYAGNVTHIVMNRIIAITTCIYGWWKALWLQFCEKPIFPYNKGINFI